MNDKARVKENLCFKFSCKGKTTMNETNFDYATAIENERMQEIAMRKQDIEGLKQQIATSKNPDAVRRCKELLIEAKLKLSQLENS